MMQNILTLYRVGNNYAAHNVILYSGLSVRNPDMKKYDGKGWSPLKKVPEGADLKKVKFISKLSLKLPYSIKLFNNFSRVTQSQAIWGDIMGNY